MKEARVDVAVIGGGLAGLAAAAEAAAAGSRVALLEGHQLGGRARADERGGFTFNRGPRALYLGGIGTQILGSFGIQPAGGKPPIKGATGVRDGRLGLLPSGPWSLLRTDLLKARSKVAVGRYLGRLPRLRPQDHAGESVDEWLEGTGLPADGADLVQLLVRVATYVNDPSRMSAEVAIGQVQLALGKGVLYLDGGFQQLVDKLAEVARQRGAALQVDTPVRSLTAEGDRFLVDLGGDSRLTAGAVVVAAGSPAAAAAVTHPTEAVPASWTELGPAATAACLELGLRAPARTTTAFGVDQPVYLNHHAPPAKALAPEGKAMVHVLRYQEPGHAASPEQDRDELRQVAALVGIENDRIEEERFLRRMVVNGGYPLAVEGGLSTRPPVSVEDRPGLFVAGDWVGPTGFLADAALASGVQAGRQAAAMSTKDRSTKETAGWRPEVAAR